MQQDVKMTTAFQQIFQDVAKSENISNAKISVEKRDTDGFFGNVKVVTIEGISKRVSLVLKTAPKDLQVREEISTEEAFSNEITFYNDIWQNYRKYLISANLSFNTIPKCYASSLQHLNEYLILEDLKAQNFTEWTSRVALNWNHSVLIAKEYAKLHALALCFKQNEPKVFQELKLNDIFYKFLDTPAKVDVTNAINENLVEYAEDHFKDAELSNRFRKAMKEMVPFYKKINKWNWKEKSTVILHGDCWSNNIMFKYDKVDSLEATSLKFIDWQVVKRGSMVFDLAHVIYVCSSKSVYDNLDGLLEIYHQTLQSFATALGVRSDNIVTFEELIEQWQLYGRYGLYTASVQLKLLLNDTDKDTFQFSDVTDTGDVAMAAFRYVPNNDKFRTRFTDLIQHCLDRNII